MTMEETQLMPGIRTYLLLSRTPIVSDIEVFWKVLVTNGPSPLNFPTRIFASGTFPVILMMSKRYHCIILVNSNLINQFSYKDCMGGGIPGISMQRIKKFSWKIDYLGFTNSSVDWFKSHQIACNKYFISLLISFASIFFSTKIARLLSQL